MTEKRYNEIRELFNLVYKKVYIDLGEGNLAAAFGTGFDEICRELKETEAKYKGLRNSVDESLNSGDGSYRP